MTTDVQKTHKLVTENGISYYTVDGLRDIQNEMLWLLSIINKICKENDIQYWIDGGTIIGALRHKGFIPWDDDFDISILKEDYLRLIKLLMQYCADKGETYLYYAPEENKHFCNYFASKRNIYVRYRGGLRLESIKIDIRPINVIPNKHEELEKSKKYRDIANCKLFKKSFWNNDVETVLENVNFEEFADFYNNRYGLFNREKGIYIHPYYEFSGDFYWKYEDIFPLRKVQFENVEVFIPNKVEIIMSNLYGNYMTMLPLEHRAPVAYEVVKGKTYDCADKNNSVKRIIDTFGFFKAVKIVLFERIFG